MKYIFFYINFIILGINNLHCAEKVSIDETQVANLSENLRTTVGHKKRPWCPEFVLDSNGSVEAERLHIRLLNEDFVLSEAEAEARKKMAKPLPKFPPIKRPLTPEPLQAGFFEDDENGYPIGYIPSQESATAVAQPEDSVVRTQLMCVALLVEQQSQQDKNNSCKKDRSDKTEDSAFGPYVDEVDSPDNQPDVNCHVWRRPNFPLVIHVAGTENNPSFEVRMCRHSRDFMDSSRKTMNEQSQAAGCNNEDGCSIGYIPLQSATAVAQSEDLGAGSKKVHSLSVSLKNPRIIKVEPQEPEKKEQAEESLVAKKSEVLGAGSKKVHSLSVPLKNPRIIKVEPQEPEKKEQAEESLIAKKSEVLGTGSTEVHSLSVLPKDPDIIKVEHQELKKNEQVETKTKTTTCCCECIVC